MRVITLEEHKEFGEQCKKFYHLLINLQIEKYNTAKTKALGKEITLHERKAIESLLRLRSHLEDIMFKDYPEENKNTKIYYGAAKNMNQYVRVNKPPTLTNITSPPHNQLSKRTKQKLSKR